MNISQDRDNLLTELTQPLSGNGKPVRCLTLNGETHSIKQWAEITGIKRATIYERLENGWPIEKVLSKPPCRNLAYKVPCSDGTFRSLGEAADMLGISRNTVYNRIRRGLSVEQSLVNRNTATNPFESLKLRQLNSDYRDLVRLVGELRRDGSAPSVAWFSELDSILDRIWSIEEEDTSAA